MAAHGANVTILARGQAALQDTEQALIKARKSEAQVIEAHSLDLVDASKVEAFVASLKTLPTAVFCAAGGTADEIGYFADISCQQIRSCFEMNYFSGAFITNAILKRWLAEPAAKTTSRHIVLTSSTAALTCLPGYAAYLPAKTATRALVDLLRQELLLYREQQDIRVHCSFPGTILSEAFYHEQKRKPKLCIELEESDKPNTGLTPAAVAEIVLAGLKQGKFFITMDMDTTLLLNNMRGPSPRDFAVWDWILGFVGSLVWPFYRWSWDRATIKHGKSLNQVKKEAVVGRTE